MTRADREVAAEYAVVLLTLWVCLVGLLWVVWRWHATTPPETPMHGPAIHLEHHETRTTTP